MIHAQLRAHTKQAQKNTSAPPPKKNHPTVFGPRRNSHGGEMVVPRGRGGGEQQDNQVGFIPSHPLALAPAQLGLCLQVPSHRWQPSPQFSHPRRHLIFPGDKRGLGERGEQGLPFLFRQRKKKPSCLRARTSLPMRAQQKHVCKASRAFLKN